MIFLISNPNFINDSTVISPMFLAQNTYILLVLRKEKLYKRYL